MVGLQLATVAFVSATISSAFAPPTSSLFINSRIGYPQSNTLPALRLSSSSDSDGNESPLGAMDDEHRSSLFQTLLRDLQIEGVPLLGCDADQVATLNAAIWTTMAELGDNDNEQQIGRAHV